MSDYGLPMCGVVRRAERILMAGQGGLLVASIATAAALSTASQWRGWPLFCLLLVVAVASEAFQLNTRRYKLSAAFLALVLAMVFLGPAPSVALGVLSIGLTNILRGSPWRHVLVNLSTYAFFPLAGAVAFDALGGRALLEANPPAYVLAVLVLFLAMNLLNFLLVAVDVAVVDGQGVAAGLRLVYLPVVPVECATGLFCAGMAYAYHGDNLAVIVLLAAIGLIVQTFLRGALRAIEHKDALEERTRELAALQVGVLSTMLQTLSLRDKMTARHSAAVARYSRAVARELGLSEEEQDLVHTAALLHDIGKFIFPDSILFAGTRLTDEEYAIVRLHPEQGAQVVARMDGYGPVAEIILAHHERIDGGGYPNGLAGTEIPLAARIISVADTYDVMTSRDSYRRPVSPADAVAELRRVSGTQLDGDIVELFIALLERRSISFRHVDDADFERELNRDHRIREYASPRRAVAA